MSRENTKQVRAILAKHYESWVTYNDICADKKRRRIKVMQNGYIYPAQQYTDWEVAIKKDLVEAGIWHEKAGFKVGHCWRGAYVYYSVVIEA